MRAQGLFEILTENLWDKSLPISRAEANSPYLFPLHDGSVCLHPRACPWIMFDLSTVSDVVIT